MALSGLSMLLLLFATILLPNIAVAKVYMVGDQIGWTTDFNYQVWAAGKTFNVGDALVFRYPVGRHNVFKVDGTAFQSCIVPPPSEALTSGIDIITLETPGRKWYICGVGAHCQEGQRLAIDVEPSSTVFPPSPSYLSLLPPLLPPRPVPVAELSPQPAPESEAVPNPPAPAPESESEVELEPIPPAPAPESESEAGLEPIPPAPAPAPVRNPPNALVKLKKFLTISH